MGYMHEGIELGFTITINKSNKLSKVLERQKSILDTYSLIRRFQNAGYQQINIGEDGFVISSIRKMTSPSLPIILCWLYRPSRKRRLLHEERNDDDYLAYTLVNLA